MKIDKDLKFLQFCNNDELVTLCDILTNDDKGGYRMTEQLTYTDNYINFYPQNMQKMWPDIASELQRYGGNTLLNVFMRNGVGPSYNEIVNDVCRMMNIDIPIHSNTAQMESLILDDFIDRALSKMSEQKLYDLCDELNILCYNNLPKYVILAMLIVARKRNYKVYMNKIHVILSFLERCIVGRGVMKYAGFVIGRPLVFLFGPIGMAVWSIAGPAYRVTVPAVIQVALMRMDYMSSIERKEAA